jgi:hypothetical protein
MHGLSNYLRHLHTNFFNYNGTKTALVSLVIGLSENVNFIFEVRRL